MERWMTGALWVTREFWGGERREEVESFEGHDTAKSDGRKDRRERQTNQFALIALRVRNEASAMTATPVVRLGGFYSWGKLGGDG